MARNDLRKPLHHRAGHHRHELERTAFLWATERRGVNGFVGSGQCVAGIARATLNQREPFPFFASSMISRAAPNFSIA